MKVLLFGGAGQLGWEVRARAHDLNFEVVAPVVTELDIGNAEQVNFLAERFRPEVILNCAAYTAVDKAEEERDEAFRVNAEGVRVIAEAAKRCSARLIHISTDYVFEGNGREPLTEEAPTNPQNVYGASKLAGEKAVAEVLGDRGLVVRTSSLHGKHGENFVHTMIRLFSERPTVSVVQDQWMSPTWAGWLAEVLVDLCRIEVGGVVHASCAGVITWFDFAAHILERIAPTVEAARRVTLVPTTAAQFARAAKRPTYSAFDCSKLATILGRPSIPWTEGADRHLAELGYAASRG